MALKLALDSVEGLDDATQKLYTQKGDKFVLDVEGIEDTGGLKTALQKERERAAAASKQLKPYEKLGKTPEEIQAIIDERTALEEQKAREAGDFDKIRAQIKEAHQRELAQRDETAAQLRKRLNDELIDARATAAIAAAKGVPDLLLPHVQRQVKVDDQFNVRVVDAQGDPRVNSKGDPMTIADLVSEMRSSDVFGRAFEASGQSGGGTPPANGGGGNPQQKVTRRSDLKTREQRAAFLNQFGQDAYFALPD